MGWNLRFWELEILEVGVRLGEFLVLEANLSLVNDGYDVRYS